MTLEIILYVLESIIMGQNFRVILAQKEGVAVTIGQILIFLDKTHLNIYVGKVNKY